MDRAKIYAYYPTEQAPSGSYEIYLEYFSKYYGNKQIQIKIGEIEYNGEVKKWIVDENSEFWILYTKGLEDISSFKIITKYAEDRGDSNTKTSSVEKVTNHWRFVVYFKTKEEKFYGNIEHPNLYDNVTEDFCKNFVYTTGDTKTPGAVCPIDTETNLLRCV